MRTECIVLYMEIIARFMLLRMSRRVLRLERATPPNEWRGRARIWQYVHVSRWFSLTEPVKHVMNAQHSGNEPRDVLLDCSRLTRDTFLAWFSLPLYSLSVSLSSLSIQVSHAVLMHHHGHRTESLVVGRIKQAADLSLYGPSIETDVGLP